MQAARGRCRARAARRRAARAAEPPARGRTAARDDQGADGEDHHARDEHAVGRVRAADVRGAVARARGSRDHSARGCERRRARRHRADGHAMGEGAGLASLQRGDDERGLRRARSDPGARPRRAARRGRRPLSALRGLPPPVQPRRRERAITGVRAGSRRAAVTLTALQAAVRAAVTRYPRGGGDDEVPACSRRTLLAAAVRGAAGAALGAALPIRLPAPPAEDVIDLGRGFHVLTLDGNNVLAVAAGDGLALVDGGTAAQSPRFLELAAALPGGRPVRTLFNTHWHPEQTGSNEALGRAGAAIVAHVNTRLWLTTDVTWPWNDVTVEPLPEVAWPSRTFFDRETVALGDKRVECGHLRDCPHTDGDMYVFFPEDNVMAVGGAV